MPYIMTSKNLSSHVNVNCCSLCQGYTEYYCLTCEANLCSACKMKHLIRLDTKEHNINLYKYKNRVSCTREPCEKHPNQAYEMYCKICDLPICVDCKDHKEHNILDVMAVYEEHKKIINIVGKDTLYNLQVLLQMIKYEYKNCDKKTGLLTSEMAKKLRKLKAGLNIISLDGYLSSKGIENSLLKKIQTQIDTMNKHLSKIKMFDNSLHKFSHKPVQFLRFMKKARFPDIKKTPFLVEHFLLLPTEVDLQDLIKLLNIKINERGKRYVGNEQMLKLVSEPELQKSSSLKYLASCEHISCVTQDQAWVSEGNQIVLMKITTGKPLHILDDAVCGLWWGMHTVNIDRELLYISNDNTIMKLSYDRKAATKLFGPFLPSCQLRSLFYSSSTGDLLIGMHILDEDTHEEYGIVRRYAKSGQLTMTIPDDNTKKTLFKDPNYVTENNKRDVVVSDYWRGVVVTDYRGKHLFTYIDTPFESRLLPRGICTDVLSNILVCDCYTESIHILNKEGCFLLYIPAQISHDPYGKPCSLSYDLNTHLLWVGSWNNTVSRYRHIHRRFALTDSEEIDDKDTVSDYTFEVSNCFNIPGHCEESSPFLSDFKISKIEMDKSSEEPGSLMDELKVICRQFIIETIPRIFNEGNERALKFNISQDQAIDELFPGTNLKFWAPLHANMAKYITEMEGEEDGSEAMELKLFQIEIECYFFYVAQNADIDHIMDVLFEDKDMLIMVTEIVRERMEIIEEIFNIKNASVREIRDLAMEIFNLVMDVVLLINQVKETDNRKRIRLKERRIILY